MTREEQIKRLEYEWAESPRWKSVTRTYSASDVAKLRGSVQIEHTLARLGSEKFWRLINQQDPVCGLGALTGNQAIQEVQAGLKAIYCSGWQVAGDGNSAGEMYPDQNRELQQFFRKQEPGLERHAADSRVGGGV